jgi:hypothetical protein
MSQQDKDLTTLAESPEITALPTEYAAINCDTYKEYRSILKAAIPIIAKIPIIGSKVAPLITFLMGIADGVCKVGVEGEEEAGKSPSDKPAAQGITVFSLCTPVCNTYTPVPCAQGGAGPQVQAAPQGLTVFSLCTPVCNTFTPVRC